MAKASLSKDGKGKKGALNQNLNVDEGGLLIVESPTKERTISSILGKNFVVKSCWGHVRDLPRTNIGIDIANGFTPRYVVVKSKSKIIKDLKTLAKKAQHIYLATDFDREGEAIAWHLSEVIGPDPAKVSRITFHEITPRAIQEAIQHPRRIDLDLVQAQQTRRIIDRLVGYNLSPLLWEKLQRGLSAGRVQSVALGFIAERDIEIDAFKPQEYWTLHAKLSTGKNTEAPFTALLVKKGNKKIDKLDIRSKEEVEIIVRDLDGKEFKISQLDSKEISRSSPMPFNTASLQQAAYRAFGFSPAKTMRFAQALYEGKSLPEGHVGLITYMRTDSVSIAREAKAEAVHFIRERFGANYLGAENKRSTSKSKFAQEAHEAIRPTSLLREPQAVASYLVSEEAKLYELIWVRFLQSQMADQRLLVTTVSIAVNDALFRASGSVILFDGYKRISIRSLQEEGSETGSQILPPLSQDQLLQCLGLLPQQHFTEPPPRYNSASLVKAMETNGVGRPSTYAPTIQTLLNRNYVLLNKKVFISTDLGRKVYENLKKHFASIVDVGFTAQMEGELDSIATKKTESLKILGAFWKVFEADLEEAKIRMEVQKIAPLETEWRCDLCGSPLLQRESRFGKYLSCKNFPSCKFKVGLTPTGQKKIVKKTTIPCEKCGALLVERVGRRGSFLACPNFPKCRFTKALPKPNDSPSAEAAS